MTAQSWAQFPWAGSSPERVLAQALIDALVIGVVRNPLHALRRQPEPTNST